MAVFAHLRRLDCPEHGVLVEAVPFAGYQSGFTRDFQDVTAYLTTKTDKTTIARFPPRLGSTSPGPRRQGELGAVARLPPPHLDTCLAAVEQSPDRAAEVAEEDDARDRGFPGLFDVGGEDFVCGHNPPWAAPDRLAAGAGSWRQRVRLETVSLGGPLCGQAVSGERAAWAVVVSWGVLSKVRGAALEMLSCVCPRGVLVVGGASLQAAVQDPDEPVSQPAQRWAALIT